MNLFAAYETGLDDTAFRLVLDTIRDGVYVVDRERRIIYWNRGAEQLSGYSSLEVVGRCCHEGMLAHVDHTGRCLCTDGCPLAATMCDNQPRRADVYMHHKDGHRVPVNVEAAALLDKDGKVWGAVEVFYDNSADHSTRRALRMFQRMAMMDTLTGLPNRRFLDNYLSRQREETEPRLSLSLMLLDIDHFKRVNDQYGHDIGDRALKAVASTLRGLVSSPDIAGRWGGEEFLLVFHGAGERQLLSGAHRILSLIEAGFIDTPQGTLRVTASAGVTPIASNESIEQALDRADRALYRSKANGRNRFTWAAAA